MHELDDRELESVTGGKDVAAAFILGGIDALRRKYEAPPKE